MLKPAFKNGFTIQTSPKIPFIVKVTNPALSSLVLRGTPQAAPDNYMGYVSVPHCKHT